MLLSLAPLPAEINRVFIAYSGGLDSTVLLHLAVDSFSGIDIIPWHVNHGLITAAAEMQNFCVQYCNALGLKIRVDQLEGPVIERNIEAEARRMRYEIFERHSHTGDAVMTAHHADDQAETFLQNALRGAGSGGLRGIARQRPLGQAILLRPLLDFGRDQLMAYANQRKLEWFDDPSNGDPRFDRNYLRQAVLPVLRERWPHYAASLASCSQIQSETRQLLDQLAAMDCQQVTGEDDGLPVLRLDAIRQLPTPRVRNLLRFWLARNALAPMPRNRLDELMRQLDSRGDAEPRIDMPDYSIRIYDNRLFIVPEPNPVPPQGDIELGTAKQIKLDTHGVILSRREIFERCDLADQGQALVLRFATDGRASTDRHRLKRLFQRHRVPPWRRSATAQVYIGDRLSGLLA